MFIKPNYPPFDHSPISLATPKLLDTTPSSFKCEILNDYKKMVGKICIVDLTIFRHS